MARPNDIAQPLMHRVVRAAIYARYSSEMQSAASAEDQIARLQYSASRGQIPTRCYPDGAITILPEWIQKDEAITGKVAGRRGYQAIVQGIRQRAFDVLLVDDLSRLTRSLGNLLELYQLLRHHDVELVSIADRLSSADPNAKTFFTVKGMVADFGNDAHAERTRRGLEVRARAGFSTGQKPYGYTATPTHTERRKGRAVASHFQLVVHPEQAEMVRTIFALYAHGYGKVTIATKLNRQGIPPPRPDSRGWRVGPIERMLRNEKYIGRWVYNRHTYSFDPDTGRRVQKTRLREEWVVTETEALRIVSQDVWDQVQSRLVENHAARHHPTRNRHQQIFGPRDRIDQLGLLTGVLICAHCGGACALVTGRRGGYYGCVDAHRHGTCPHKALLRKAVAEQALVAYLNEHLVANPQVIQFATAQWNAGIKAYLQRRPTRRKIVEGELQRVAKEIAHLVDFIAQGHGGDIETLTTALRERERRQQTLEAERRTLGDEDEQKLLVTPYLIRDRLQAFCQTLVHRGDRYRDRLKVLFQHPLRLAKQNDHFELTGQLELGGVVQGSRHCMNALPTGFEPVFQP